MRARTMARESLVCAFACAPMFHNDVPALERMQRLRRACQTTRQPRPMMIGFGPRKPAHRGAGSGGGGGAKKKPRTIRATYLELVRKGATEYVCFVRASGSGDSGWLRVGTMVAENDDYSAAVTMNKRVLLEHAKRLHPKLGMVKVLDLGVAKDEEGATPSGPCERKEGAVTSAFSPDAAPTRGYYAPRRPDGRPMPIDTRSKDFGNILQRERRNDIDKTPSE